MKLRYGLFALIFIAITVLLGRFVMTAMNGPVERVEIDGALSASERVAVEQAIASLFPAGMLSADLDALVAEVDGLDWVEQVRVRRSWPDTLVLSVTKPTLVARWAEGGYVSSRGELVAMADSTVLGELPVLGARYAEPARAIELFELFSNRVAEAGLSLAALTESKSGEWTVRLAGDIEVRLGRTDLNARLERALGVIATELARWLSLVSAVDARYHNGVAVSWRDASPLVAAPSSSIAGSITGSMTGSVMAPAMGEVE